MSQYFITSAHWYQKLSSQIYYVWGIEFRDREDTSYLWIQELQCYA